MAGRGLATRFTVKAGVKRLQGENLVLHTRGRRGVNLGAMKRFVLIALLLTDWVVPEMTFFEIASQFASQ